MNDEEIKHQMKYEEKMRILFDNLKYRIWNDNQINHLTKLDLLDLINQIDEKVFTYAEMTSV